MFHYNGAVNDLLGVFGVEKIDWLKSSYSIIVIVILFLWKNLGYNMILFMAALAAIVKLTPILLPVVTGVGVSPLHIGINMVVNLALGFLTPPVGVNLFVASGVAQAKIEKIAVAVLPMIALMLIVLAIITYCPSVPLMLVH